jgi:hypothetical protein
MLELNGVFIVLPASTPSYFPSGARLAHRVRSSINCVRTGGFMDILAAIKREERKLEMQLGKLQAQLNRFRAAAKALGHSTSLEVPQLKKRVLSAAARAKISKASKARWAKFRAENSKKAKT